MLKATRVETIVTLLKPTVDNFKCAPVELIIAHIEERGWSSYVDHKDVGRALRVYHGVEFTACDENDVPSTLSGRCAVAYLHPSRVKRTHIEKYVNWCRAISNSWLRKADRFEADA